MKHVLTSTSSVLPRIGTDPAALTDPAPMQRAAATGPATAAATPAVPLAGDAVSPHDRGRHLRFDLRLILSLAAVYVFWSSTYLAIRIAVRELPPLLMASSRYVAAGLVMLALARRRGAAWPSARQWLRVAPVGALLFVGGNGFVVLAELTVSSGGAAVVCATMPIWASVLTAIGGERPSWREWLSLGVGFTGVLVLMGGPSLDGAPSDLVLVVLSPICWALGSVLARRQARSERSDAVLSSAMQMITGGVGLVIAGVVHGERFTADASASAWFAVGYLAVFGSLIGFTAYNWLLHNTRPVVATSYAYVNPILAVILGAAISGEPLGVTTLIANVLIIGAIGLALARPRLPRTS